MKIDTGIRLAMTGAIRRYMAENPSRFDPRDYLKPAMAAAKGVCKERYQQFGCAGMAPKIKPVPLDKIAAKYKSGELKQIVNEFLIVGPYDALPLGARPGLLSL